MRLLAQILEDAGYHDTAQKLADAISLQAIEAPLTIVDHEAILTSFGVHCSTGLVSSAENTWRTYMRRRRSGSK